MFMLTLPKDATEGDCRINGQPAEFRRTPTAIAWRYKADATGPWDTRTIIHAQPVPGDLISYVCEDADGGNDFLIFPPPATSSV